MTVTPTQRESRKQGSVSARKTATPRLSLAIIQRGTVLALTIGLVVVSWSKSGSAPLWADDLSTYAAPIGILACGMTFVMIAGGFDLSVASITAVSGVVYVLVLGQLVGLPGLRSAAGILDS